MLAMCVVWRLEAKGYTVRENHHCLRARRPGGKFVVEIERALHCTHLVAKVRVLPAEPQR